MKGQTLVVGQIQQVDISDLVSRELIEQWFTTGFELRGLLRVKEGIPAGARLSAVRMDPYGLLVWLLFETQELGSASTCEQQIIVEQIREASEVTP